MSTEEERIHTEGPRWEIVRRFDTYQEANNHRNGLLIETDLVQVKVHLMGRAGQEFFAVKTRLDPAAQQPTPKKKKKSKNKKRSRR